MKNGRRGHLALMAGLVAGGTLGAGLPPRPARAQSAGASPTGTLRVDGPKALPAFSVTDPEGVRREMPFFAGKGVVLNLWATWCPPCVEEMPALDRLAGLLAGDNILVIPASSDRNGRAMVEPFYARTGIRNLGIWLDPNSAATRALGARGLPTTVLIDRLGRERARLEGGAAWDGAALLAEVRRRCGDGRPRPRAPRWTGREGAAPQRRLKRIGTTSSIVGSSHSPGSGGKPETRVGMASASASRSGSPELRASRAETTVPSRRRAKRTRATPSIRRARAPAG